MWPDQCYGFLAGDDDAYQVWWTGRQARHGVANVWGLEKEAVVRAALQRRGLI